MVEKTADTALVKNEDHVVVDLTGQGEYCLKVYRREPPMLESLNRAFFPPIHKPERAVLFGRAIGLLRVGISGFGG